jgi:hypothetical protein
LVYDCLICFQGSADSFCLPIFTLTPLLLFVKQMMKINFILLRPRSSGMLHLFAEETFEPESRRRKDQAVHKEWGK